MATPPFHYEPMFQKGPDTTEYYLLTKDYVSVSEFEGKPILKVAKEGLTAMANAAFRDVSFMLRRSHNEQVAKILSDPEATDNDKYVALTFLRNAEVAAKGVLPFCQDTGTAIIHGEKGQQVWTGYCDEEAISKGVYKTYTEEALRQSQNAPLTMYEEVNTKCNLPAQIDIEATEGAEYKFLCVVKGGGSANKSYLYQETKAVLNPAKLVPYLIEKMKSLGTAACPPYHIAFVIGGTSAERTMLTVKLASCHYYDGLPTTGDDTGRAFRDVELEQQLLEEAWKLGLGAQFGGKYMAHAIRVIRLPRHGASCPIGMGVSCSADRNIKCKINEEGIWVEKRDDNPARLIPEELRKPGEAGGVTHGLGDGGDVPVAAGEEQAFAGGEAAERSGGVDGVHVAGQAAGLGPRLQRFGRGLGRVGVEGRAVVLDDPALDGVGAAGVDHQRLVDEGGAAVLAGEHHRQDAGVLGLGHGVLQLLHGLGGLGQADLGAQVLVPEQAGHRQAARHGVQVAVGADLAVGADAVDRGLRGGQLPAVGVGVLLEVDQVVAAGRGADVGDAGEVRGVGRGDDARPVLLGDVVGVVGGGDRDVRVLLLEAGDQRVVEGFQAGAVPQGQLVGPVAQVGADLLGGDVGRVVVGGAGTAGGHGGEAGDGERARCDGLGELSDSHRVSFPWRVRPRCVFFDTSRPAVVFLSAYA